MAGLLGCPLGCPLGGSVGYRVAIVCFRIHAHNNVEVALSVFPSISV